jgi:AcrR family transcriptional regulator
MRADDRRSQLMEAALAAFSRGGYHGTHVSHIIKEAGVARGTFYLYFDSKRGVFQALIDEMFVSLDSVLEVLDPRAPTSPVEQLRRNLERFVGVLQARPELTTLLLEQGAPLEPEVRDRLRRFYADLTAKVEQGLAMGQELGLFEPVDREVVARAIVGAVKEVFYGWDHQRETFDPRRVADALIHLTLHGLVAPQGA